MRTTPSPSPLSHVSPSLRRAYLAAWDAAVAAHRCEVAYHSPDTASARSATYDALLSLSIALPLSAIPTPESPASVALGS